MKRSAVKLIRAGLLMFIFSIAITGFFEASGVESEDLVRLTILHTNDFHGFDYHRLARQATIIKSIRAELEKTAERHVGVLQLEAGDIFARGPYARIYFGKIEFAVLNLLNYHAITLGNNEFKATADIDAQNHLLARVSQAKPPVLCANVLNGQNGKYLPGVVPYTIKELNGLKVGIFGVTTLKIENYLQIKGLKVEDPIVTAQKIYPVLSAQADIVIALTHTGYSQDKVLAKTIPGLTAIVGGDSHKALRRGSAINNIPIVQAGCNGKYLGRLDLYLECQNGRWMLKKYEACLIPINKKIPEDPEILELINSFFLEKSAA